MKNKLLTIVIAILVISAIFFLAGAFWHASFNIKEWSEDARGIMATIWTVIMICTIVIIGGDDEK